MENRRIKISLFAGIIAMVLLVSGTVSESGSILQKILFVTGATILGITAYLNKQKMFVVLQAVATIGAILAFFPDLPEIKYALMVGSAIIGIVYLSTTGYYKQDEWGILGSIGLVLVAIGFATNPVRYPTIFGFLLGFGGIAIAAYSAIGFFKYKVKISLIWLVLNIIFSINPILLFMASR